MSNVTWDEYFAKMAEMVSTKSKDLNTKIGAVIAGPDNEIRSTGCNSFPRGLNDEVPERQERPEKYFFFEHAERNAVYNAARVGIPTKGCRMFLNCGVPCADCARAIIQAGIVEVIVASTKSSNIQKWEESAQRSLLMFEECGVRVRPYDDS